MRWCDSVSALYKQEKLKFLKLLGIVLIHEVLFRYSNPNADPQPVANARKRFLCALYGVLDKEESSLNKTRYQSSIKTDYKTTLNIVFLPPTEGATHQHSLYMYYQAQLCLGNNKIQINGAQWKLRTDLRLSQVWNHRLLKCT